MKSRILDQIISENTGFEVKVFLNNGTATSMYVDGFDGEYYSVNYVGRNMVLATDMVSTIVPQFCKTEENVSPKLSSRITSEALKNVLKEGVGRNVKIFMRSGYQIKATLLDYDGVVAVVKEKIKEKEVKEVINIASISTIG